MTRVHLQLKGNDIRVKAMNLVKTTLLQVRSNICEAKTVKFGPCWLTSGKEIYFDMIWVC